MSEEQFQFHTSGTFKLEVGPRGDPEALAAEFKEYLETAIKDWLSGLPVDAVDNFIVETSHRSPQLRQAEQLYGEKQVLKKQSAVAFAVRLRQEAGLFGSSIAAAQQQPSYGTCPQCGCTLPCIEHPDPRMVPHQFARPMPISDDNPLKCQICNLFLSDPLHQ